MPWPQRRRIIGTEVRRLDGPVKATGRAKYSFDINRPGMLHAKILRTPHAHCRVTAIDTAAARRVPGFRAVYVITDPEGNNNELFYAGAEVLAIAADTEEHCEDAIRACVVRYQVLPHFVRESAARAAGQNARTMGADFQGNPRQNIRRGGQFTTNNFEQQAYQNTAARASGTYGVPVICHQCLESHGLVAEWNDDQNQLTVWASTQAVFGVANALAQRFQLPPAQVKCITHHMGGGYGSKFNPGVEGFAAAELAKLARAPVKLMLDRAEEVTTAGNRPSAYGTVTMAANQQGDIRAFEVDCYGTSGVGAGATVNLGLLPYVYDVPFIKRSHDIIQLNAGAARAMRAPGHPQNCVLTEWVLDDLAARLNLDPLQMRLRNIPQNDANAVQNAPTSFNALRHTIYSREIQIAQELSNWNRKWHAPGMGQGTVVKRGIGMALHTWGGRGRGPNDHTVAIHRDGSVVVRSSTQDLGTAQRTVEAIVVAEVLGLNVDQITVEIGESQFGRSMGSGGSTTCPGTAPAAFNAANAAKDAFFQAIAPRLNAQAANLEIQPGHVVDTNNNRRYTWREACARLGQMPATGDGNWDQSLSSQGVGGVQIAEVTVDTETGVVKCDRVVAVQDCGMVINKLGCESQVAGGVIMGVNYALFEERIMDQATGRQVNPDMEFYKLAGILDIPDIKVHMHDMPERGVIGIGEPPTISTCAAIGNAVFNAIGVRVPEAPFTPERVLAALARRNNGGN